MQSCIDQKRALLSEEGSPHPHGMREQSWEEVTKQAEGNGKSEAYYSNRGLVTVLVMLSSSSKF